jgi:deleted-in-malignant-brain-tumors protein 1
MSVFVAIRLVGGSEHEGRVEIFNQGVWGTVCDTYWDDKDAGVACKQLGYSRGGKALGGAHYGRGSGPVWLDKVVCLGNEKSLTDCRSCGLGRTSCSHSRDASIQCHIV